MICPVFRFWLSSKDIGYCIPLKKDKIAVLTLTIPSSIVQRQRVIVILVSL
jgi:hypothetical protein